MSTNTKPLAEWTLGETREYCAGRDDCKLPYPCPFWGGSGKRCMTNFANLDLTEQPSFTEDEVATMRVLYAAGARYIARDKCGFVFWSEGKPEKDEFGIYGCLPGNLAALPESMFSSILPSDSITIADIIKNEKEK